MSRLSSVDLLQKSVQLGSRLCSLKGLLRGRIIFVRGLVCCFLVKVKCDDREGREGSRTDLRRSGVMEHERTAEYNDAGLGG